MSDYDEPVPEESEQLDQIQADDSLIDRGVSDVLDEGYIAPDGWSPAEGFGNTPAEMRQGETLDMRLAQETPEIAPPDETPLAKSPSHSLLGRAVEVLADAFAERVAVALDRILRARAAQADESWGIVSQKTLPPWIHPDTYVEACRTGAIPEAKI